METKGKQFYQNGVLMKYEDRTLWVDYVRGALTLPEVLRSLNDAGIIAQMIADANTFERKHSWTTRVTSGMSGRQDFFVDEYQNKGNFRNVRKSHHVLHISCVDKLNEGIRAFGPDFIAILWTYFKDLTYTVIKAGRQERVFELQEPKELMQPGTMFFFPLERKDELKALVSEFRQQTGACWAGTIAFLWEDSRVIPEIWKNRMPSELREQVEHFTDEDWNMLHEYGIENTVIVDTANDDTQTEEEAPTEE